LLYLKINFVQKKIHQFRNLNHWTMLNEVAEGSWSGNGQIFSFEAIKKAMNIPSDSKAA